MVVLIIEDEKRDGESCYTAIPFIGVWELDSDTNTGG